MRTRIAPSRVAVLWVALLSRVGAQAPPERERVFCDTADRCNQCDRFCVCLDDTLEVTFEGDTAFVLEYETLCPVHPPRVTRSSSSCSNVSLIAPVLPEAMAASRASFEG
jgi:hypothetical protein